MTFTILTAGTGSYYCGACMRDNALAKALVAAGHEVSLLPMYLPMQLDEDTLPQNDTPIFFGGINVYLQQKLSFFRRTPAWFDRLLNSTGLLRAAAKRSHMTSPREHGEMALAMLEIEDSPFGKETAKLLDWLASHPPDVLVLSNALLAGFIRTLKRRLDCPIMAFFQGEDSFLDGLPEPFRSRCWGAMQERLADADLLVAPSRFYADLMRERFDAPDLAIGVMPNGIDLDGYRPAPPAGGPPTIGYLARMIREKGVEQLVEAFIHLRNERQHPDARLHIAGTATAGDRRLIDDLRQRLEAAGLEDAVRWSFNISHEEKAGLLAGFSLFSVPVTYPEAFGLYAIEALAAGTPLVMPDASAFPEIVARSQAGRLVAPEDPQALAAAWHELLDQPDELATYRENARRAAEEFYSVDAMRDRFLALATPLAAGR